MEALRFCASAAALLGDISLMPVIVEGLDAVSSFNEEAPNTVVAMAEELTALLSAGAAVAEDVRVLARHAFVEVRKAVAVGLSGRDLDADETGHGEDKDEEDSTKKWMDVEDEEDD